MTIKNECEARKIADEQFNHTPYELKQLNKRIELWKSRKGSNKSFDNLKELTEKANIIKNEIEQRKNEFVSLLLSGELLVCPTYPEFFVKDDEVYNIVFNEMRKAPYYLTSKGYFQIHKHIGGGKYKLTLAHRVIADAYYGKCPEGLEIDHIDRNRTNNKHENLRYVSRRDNVLNQNPRHINDLDESDKKKIISMYEDQCKTPRFISNKMKIGLMTICAVLNEHLGLPEKAETPIIDVHEKIYDLYVNQKVKQRDIARRLGLNYFSISRIIRFYKKEKNL